LNPKRLFLVPEIFANAIYLQIVARLLAVTGKAEVK
jgi:hypothetical protein